MSVRRIDAGAGRHGDSPHCGGAFAAAVTERAVAKRILECMGLPPRAPPLMPASAPDIAIDPWLTEPTVADFDQTPPNDWDPGA